MAERLPPDVLDRRIAALGRLYRTRGGKKIIKDHGPAILSLMVSDIGGPDGR